MLINNINLDKFIIRTPLLPFHSDDADVYSKIYLKPENLQIFGSYKIRGIASVIRESMADELQNGLAAASAGNMAQSVAFAAKYINVPCRIYIPETAPQVKKDMIQKLGAEIVELPFNELWKYVSGVTISPNDRIFIHPAFCDALLKGYEAIACEIIEDLPDVDAVIIPFGVGGLNLGVGRAISRHNKNIAIYACEPETAAPLKASLLQGRATSINRIYSFVDAIGTPEVLPGVFQSLSPIVSDSITTSLEEIKAALKILLLKHKLLCEGAAGCSLAAAIQIARQKNHHNIVCILTGGNIATKVIQEMLLS